MKSPTLALRVAGTIFGLVSLGQLCRVLLVLEISIAGRQVPLWLSGLAVVFAGALSWWMWRASGCVNVNNRAGSGG